MIWLEQKPEKPQLQHYRLQTSGQNCQCPLKLGAERKARKSSGQLQAPRNPLQEPACAGKGTHGANSHISPVENGAGAANPRLRIPSSLPFPHLFGLHLAEEPEWCHLPDGALWNPLLEPQIVPSTASSAPGDTRNHPSLPGHGQGTWLRHFRDFRSCRGMERHRFHGKGKYFTFLPTAWGKLGTWLTALNSRHLQA